MKQVELSDTFSFLGKHTMGLEGEEIGSWRLLECLGAGGIAEVYRAEHIHLQHSAALKLPLFEHANNIELLERFRLEAIALLRCKHPNIVEVKEFGTDPEYGFFMVLELLEGQTLGEMIEQEPLSLLWLSPVVKQLCDGLSALHQAGLVHRDIKPSNIFIVPRHSDAPLVKILDFGVAKVVMDETENRLTSSGVILGTPTHLSPEQVQSNKAVTPQSDIYALGVVLFEALTGQLPFRSATSIEQLYKVIHEPAPLVGTLRPELSGTKLEALLQQMLAKSSSERPESVEDVWGAFQQAVQQLDMPLKQSGVVPEVLRGELSTYEALGEAGNFSVDEKSVLGEEEVNGGTVSFLPQHPRRSVLWLAFGLAVLGLVGFVGLRWFSKPAPRQSSKEVPVARARLLDNFAVQGIKAFQKPSIRVGQKTDADASKTSGSGGSEHADDSNDSDDTDTQARPARRKVVVRKRTSVRGTRSIRKSGGGAFLQAERLYQRKQYKEALPLYREVLKSAHSKSHRVIVKKRIKACLCAMKRNLPWDVCKPSDYL